MAQLLDIHPPELKFMFEIKKQSSCLIRLTNKTNQTVAYKVKTTSPKKYSVRPNIGIIRPKSSCDFTVTMQAQKAAPADMVCKDKFLIQSVVVPHETFENDIGPSLFARGGDMYIEETKLRVTLISPPLSPTLSSVNGLLIDSLPSAIETLASNYLVNDDIDIKGAKLNRAKDIKLDPENNGEKGSKLVNDAWFEGAKLNRAEDIKLDPENNVEKGNELVNDACLEGAKLNPAKGIKLDPENNVEKGNELVNDAWLEGAKLNPAKGIKLDPENNVERGNELPNDAGSVLEENMTNGKDLNLDYNSALIGKKDEVINLEKNPWKMPVFSLVKQTELKTIMDKDFKMENMVDDLKLTEDMEETKSKVNKLESRLLEDEAIILKLTEERRLTMQEGKVLQEELESLRKSRQARSVEVGFPPLFVTMVALISLGFGYFLHC